MAVSVFSEQLRLFKKGIEEQIAEFTIFPFYMWKVVWSIY